MRTNFAPTEVMELESILDHAFRDRGRITSAELQRALGISRQAVWLRMRRLIEAGIVVKERAGRRTRYVPTNPIPPPMAPKVEDEEAFWNQLARAFPQLRHVPVFSFARGTEKKKDATALFEGLETFAYVIFDLDRIEHVGDAFARELLCEGPLRFFVHVGVINASPGVRQTFARVSRLELDRWRKHPWA